MLGSAFTSVVSDGSNFQFICFAVNRCVLGAEFGLSHRKKMRHVAALKNTSMDPRRCRWTLPPEPKVQDGRFPDASGASRRTRTTAPFGQQPESNIIGSKSLES